MYTHTLMIGGTGMLRAASVALARRSHVMTSVARTRRTLAALDDALPDEAGHHHMLTLDWTAPEAFRAAICAHLRKTGAPDLAVAWMHDDEFTLRLASELGSFGASCRFFHVIGSATEDPLRIARSLAERFTPPTAVTYHQVVLGYVRSGGRRRWLTNAEISAGVLEAVERAPREYVVGTVRPWVHP